MPTFVEAIQTVEDSNVAEFTRRLADRVETLDEAMGLIADWTEASRETQAELVSKYETAKRLARDEVESATDEANARDLAAEDLLDHPAVDDQTKRRLREYSTKLFVYLDEEESYGEARTELLRSLDAELDLYKDLLTALQREDASVRDAQRRIAAFARETLGPPNRTAADVVIESRTEAEAESESGTEGESESGTDSEDGSEPES
jgi:DNA replication initiation complex subunit (GINS family)